MYQDFNRKLSEFIATAAMSRSGLIFVGGWAVAEATFWFIAPDFILGIMIAFAPRAWKRLLAASLLGSLIGGVLSFTLNSLHPAWMASVLEATPFVQAKMIAFVEGIYSRHHYIGVLFQAFSFMQFKIWTHLAVLHGFNPLIYFSLVMLSRMVRFGSISFLAKNIGDRIQTLLKGHALTFVFMYTVLFLALLFALES